MRVTQKSTIALAVIITLVGVVWCSGWFGPNYAAADGSNPPPNPAEEQPEALTQGPVHESFAEPVVTQNQEIITVPNEPPASIDETPPDERPDGDNVSWVPGYWAWDADRGGHIWVSGCWRVTPPKMSWVSGYWAHVSGGWEWIPGFWTPEGNQEIEYLSAPPEIVDILPSGEPTVVDTIWVPPCYYWIDHGYSLRRGYWLSAQSGWVWTPSHYIRTPRGYIFVSGHWDYEIQNRGVLFAPVAFSAGYHVHAGYSYSPSIVINIDLLTVNMFVYPRYHHYYFGDYYDNTYITVGIYPRFEAREHGCYDPIYEHDRWENRKSDSHWEEHIRHDYSDRRSNAALRPARTYREAEAIVARAPEAQRRSLAFAQPLASAVASNSGKVKFMHVKPETRAVIAQQAVDSNKFREERRDWESKKSAPATQTPQSSRNRAGADAPTESKNFATPSANGPKSAPAQQGRGQTPAQQDRVRESPSPAPQSKENDKGKEKAAAPAENRERAPQPEQKESAAQPDRKASDAPSHDEAPSHSDKVKIRSRPIADKPGNSGSANRGNDKAPPAPPADDDRDSSSKDSRRNDGKGGPQGGDGKDSKNDDSHDSHGKSQK